MDILVKGALTLSLAVKHRRRHKLCACDSEAVWALHSANWFIPHYQALTVLQNEWTAKKQKQWKTGTLFSILFCVAVSIYTGLCAAAERLHRTQAKGQAKVSVSGVMKQRCFSTVLLTWNLCSLTVNPFICPVRYHPSLWSMLTSHHRTKCRRPSTNFMNRYWVSHGHNDHTGPRKWAEHQLTGAERHHHRQHYFVESKLSQQHVKQLS